MKVKCPICGKEGTLMYKTTKTKTTTGKYREYRKLYIYHGKNAQKKWCYLKQEDLDKIQQATGQNYTNTTQMTTQNSMSLEKPKSSFSNQFRTENKWAGSSAWNECLTCTQEAAGSNPARSTIKICGT